LAGGIKVVVGRRFRARFLGLLGETHLPDFSIRGHLLAFAVRSRNGRGLPLLQQIFFVALRLRVRSGFLPGRDRAFAPQTELKRRAIRAAKDPMPTGWRVV
jgi:hypothetical protein